MICINVDEFYIKILDAGILIFMLCFRFLVEQNCVPPLCDLLTVMDSKIVQVALNGLENILRLGETEAKMNNGSNPFAVMIEECYGRPDLKCLNICYT